jgi:hypothetical protein
MVDKSPAEVFAAINNVRGWWSGEIDGPTDKLGAEFTYRYQDLHHSTQKIAELVPGKKIVWHVKDAAINFVKDKAEWNGTDVVFKIAKRATRPNCASPMLACARPSNATASARAPGASISKTVCAAGSQRAKATQTGRNTKTKAPIIARWSGLRLFQA